MSRAFWYFFEAPTLLGKRSFGVLYEWMREEYRESYRVCRMAVDRLYSTHDTRDTCVRIPSEIWLYILSMLCEPKNTRDHIITPRQYRIILDLRSSALSYTKEKIDPMDILKWCDIYISTPELHRFEPAFMIKDETMSNVTGALGYIGVYASLEIAYCVMRIPLVNNRCVIPRATDLILGFSLPVGTSGTTLFTFDGFADAPWTETPFEFSFGNLYSHTLNELGELCGPLNFNADEGTTEKILCTDLFKRKSPTFSSFRNILPISSCSSPFTSVNIFIDPTEGTPSTISYIDVLGGLMCNNMRTAITTSLPKYKGMTYTDGRLWPPGANPTDALTEHLEEFPIDDLGDDSSELDDSDDPE